MAEAVRQEGNTGLTCSGAARPALRAPAGEGQSIKASDISLKSLDVIQESVENHRISDQRKRQDLNFRNKALTAMCQSAEIPNP